MKRATLINDVADTIALIPDAVMRSVYVQASSSRFDIDDRILLERVSKTRSEMLIAGQKEQERARMREEARAGADVPPPPVEDYNMPDPQEFMPYDVPVVQTAPVQAGPVVLNEPYLAPCEKDLLRFVLEDGCSELKFDMDSRYYIEGDQVNVAEFIDGILADDDAEFANQSYRKVYNAYFELYDEGLSQLQIQTRLMNSTDQEIAAVAKELLIEKYQITVKNYEQSLTAASTILVQYVPKTLLVYQCKKVELLMKQLTKELAGETDPERQVELLAKISDYTRARARLHNELGRV
jgi:DNA primase